jgi:hypothetical protein
MLRFATLPHANPAIRNRGRKFRHALNCKKKKDPRFELLAMRIACSPLVRIVMLLWPLPSLFLATTRFLAEQNKIPLTDSDSEAGISPQSDVSALLTSSSTSISPRVVVATFGVEAGDVKKVWVWHLTLAACAGAEVEVESRTDGRAVVVSTSCVVGVARSRGGFGCWPC